EYTKRGESCKTTADCSDGAECNDGACTSSVHPDCCWMPPIYCCGPLKYSP
ncbi:10403_t:CDS:1, partial [Gigaspora margarita]